MSVIQLVHPDTSPEPQSRGRDAPCALPGWGSLLLVGFDQGGESACVRASGWSGQEKAYVWAVGGASVLRLPGLPSHEGAYLADLDLTPLSVSPLLHTQLVQVHANGHYLGYEFVRGPSRLRFRLDAGLFAPDEPLVLEVRHPCYAQPKPLNGVADDRLLAVQVSALRIVSEDMLPRIEAAFGLPQGMTRRTLKPPPPRLPDAPGAIRRHDLVSASGPAPFLNDGWYVDAEGECAWTAARASRLDVPMPREAGRLRLQVSLSPLLVRGLKASQRVSLFCEGLALGQFSVAGATVLSVPLPPELVAGRTSLPIDLLVPDAIPMADFGGGARQELLGFAVDHVTVESMPAPLAASAGLRGDELAGPAPLAVADRFLDETLDELPAAVQAGTGKTLAELFRVFESIGDNCGFGLAQRKAGVEVLGLLRFANTPLRRLLLGLHDEFRAMTRPRDMEVYLHDEGSPREYMLRVHRYGIRWHTMVHEPDADAAAVFEQQSVKLGYLHRKFYEGLRASRKIYVLTRSEPVKTDVAMPAWRQRRREEREPAPLTLAEALPVAMALNRYGRNTLLYIVPCKPGRRSGTVELLAPGIMRAHIDKFAISNDVAVPDHAEWLRIVANAWMLDQGPNAGFRKATGPTA